MAKKSNRVKCIDCKYYTSKSIDQGMCALKPYSVKRSAGAGILLEVKKYGVVRANDNCKKFDFR